MTRPWTWFAKNRPRRYRDSGTLALGFVLFISMGSAMAQSFTAMGDLAGGAFDSKALGVSSTGSVVVGVSTSASGTEAFRWTSAGGMAGLGDLPLGGFSSTANGVSSDGSVVVGYGDRGVTEAFRWTQAGGMVGLGDLAGGTFASYAYGVSGDGAVVVGAGTSASGQEAFRWTQAGAMVGLGDLAGGSFASTARGTNSDGSVVIGYGTSASGQEAFRWTQAGGMVGLGDLAGGGFTSDAYGVSRDGTVVVGIGNGASGFEAFRWTQAGGMVGLGDLAGGGFDSAAYATNSNGSVVVGKGTSASGQEAFRWTQAGGMQRLADWLTAAGVTVAAGYTMTIARGVSDDGSVVVGESTGPSGTEAFIARVSAAGSGAITLADLSNSLVAVSSVGHMAVALADTVTNGAHSRPLARRVSRDKKTIWLAGDWGTDDHGKHNGDLGLAEIGTGQHMGNVQVNISLGQTWAKQTLGMNGKGNIDGSYLAGESLIPLHRNVWATLGGYASWGNADIRRGYLNAGAPDSSFAEAETVTWGIRARLDWEKSYRVANADFSPYVDLSHVEAKLGSYTERGGGFPAHINAHTEKATELRAGVNATHLLGNGVQILGTLEAAHRMERRSTGISGQVVGLFNFDIAGNELQQDWLRAGMGIEGKLADGIASLAFNISTRGEAANAWLAASWQKTF